MIRKAKLPAIILLIILVTASSGWLFYRQLTADPATGLYLSDLRLHFNHAVETGGVGYSINNILLYLIYRLTGGRLGAAVMSAVLVAATIAANCAFMRSREGNSVNKDTLLGIAVFPLLMSSIYLPFVYPYFYRYSLNGAIWHNETQLLMRVMSIVVLIVFFRLKERYLEKFTFRDWLAFTLTLTLTNAFKPNFVFGFAPAMLICLLTDFIENRKDAAKVRNIILFGSGVLVSLMVVAAQGLYLYSPEAVSVVEVAVGRFLFRGNLFWKIILGIGFPLSVFYYARSKGRLPPWYKFLWYMFLCDLLIYGIFTETGMRRGHENFSWGMINSVYLLNLAGVYLLIKFICEYKSGASKSKTERLYIAAGGFLLLASLISGAAYFIFLLRGAIPGI
jgi:hypothetical protein